MVKVPKRGNGEGMPPRKRKDGRYEARYTAYTTKGPKSVSVYGRTRKECSVKWIKGMAEQNAGIAFNPDTATLTTYLIRWLEDSVRGSVSHLTYIRHEQACRVHIIPGLGFKRLSKLRPENIQGLYRAKREEGISSGTIRNIHKTLRKALEQARVWGVVRENVADVVSLPAYSPKEMNPLSHEETLRFLRAAEGDRLQALWHLAIRTGMREGELLALKWRDTDLERGTLQVRRSVTVRGAVRFKETKGGKGRALVLKSRMLARLKAHYKHQLEEAMQKRDVWEGAKLGLVFPGPKGDVLRRESLIQRYEKLLRAAGIERRCFHELRHTAATLALQNNERPKVVQEMLGHASIAQTLNCYSHVLPGMLDDAAERMDSLLF